MFRIPAPELQSWLATSHSYSDRNGGEPGGSTRDPNGAIVSTMPTEMLAASHLTCFSFESPELLELWVIGRYFRGPSAICHLARQLPICFNFTTEPPTFSLIFLISYHITSGCRSRIISRWPFFMPSCPCVHVSQGTRDRGSRFSGTSPKPSAHFWPLSN